ncbi:LITAF-like zinc ribbon domain-containing protein [Ilyonectria robusta]|uniref:LITAF-like zinc ribbon domain-containing protein n=1 Tax=Ilyonectria robusta TaxID=1079257 RepID=UPI001E8D3D0D|nr:LITAF-like zinc ribbon domain-containing protein [Ilyonectria robusta]KAH8685137.1 LITAF-like zinc ribbon domain-containing protein [Ilyonectria robusta]
MSAPSPPSQSQTPAQPASAAVAVSPPSYTSTPATAPANAASSDEKIAYQPPVAAEGLEVQRPIDDENLPEVVPQPDNTLPEKAVTPVEPSLMSNPMTPPPAFSSHQNGSQGQTQTEPPRPQLNGAYSSGQNMNMMPQSGTVTPLHLLGDQSDAVDCPFCERRAMTRIKKDPSWLTHTVAVVLFFVTFCGVVAPYMLHWSSHVSHYCENCGRKVATRNFGQKGMKALGTPEHLRQQSRFQPAEPQPVNDQQV